MTQDATTHPRRVLLKLSGEVFGGGSVGRRPRRVSGVAARSPLLVLAVWGVRDLF
ncbi:hypothetical protein [Georgenia sp. SUBG003]|uniref:hypothetical protein n=1 Tax=Georgenia sp. SUBG003 TaxID=1497974 RepID=UPI003AB7D5C5